MRSSAGFTLLEAVVALTIVSLVGVASLATIGAEFGTADRGQKYLEAAALAEERMATAEIQPVEGFESLPDSIASGRFPSPFAAYSWEADRRAVGDVEGLFEMEVAVFSTAVRYELRSRTYRSAGVVLPQ